MDLKYKRSQRNVDFIGDLFGRPTPAPQWGLVRGTLLRSLASDQALFLALVMKNTQVLDKGNFLSIPERFRMGSYFLNWYCQFLCFFITRHNTRQHVIWSMTLSWINTHLSAQREQMTRRSGIERRRGLGYKSILTMEDIPGFYWLKATWMVFSPSLPPFLTPFLPPHSSAPYFRGPDQQYVLFSRFT